ncbi:patatin-like phospholipase RssA [Thiolapillus sp.]
MSKSKPDGVRIGLALGGGASRGWCHIGIIRALEEMGLRPDVIAGCSIGAIVGAARAGNNLDNLETWVCSLRRRDVAAFFDIGWGLKGLIDAPRLRKFLHEHVVSEDFLIEGMDMAYGNVATDLGNGREIWFTSGEALSSIMASIALPGLFAPVRFNGRWLVDGGLVNPVPVSLCHALGAEVVIAVNLNGDILGKHLSSRKAELAAESGAVDGILGTIKNYSSNLFPGTREDAPPGMFDVLASSVNITQDRITRSRMAGDPPDILLEPRLAEIGLLEFHRASEAIVEGERCVQRMRPLIEYTMENVARLFGKN